MMWIVAILAIVLMAVLFFLFKVLYEANIMRSMFVMAVLDREFLEGQRGKINDYMKSIAAANAIEVSKQFNAALDSMAFRIAKEAPILLGARAVLWEAFKNANSNTSFRQ
ncbi:hypothetical protein [Paludibaculum fermentans]|uniref:hypothetical protein n=1 Tax=Paludibaculum fermentans TaxID=1473598 RepID=UPI003EB6CCFC